MWRNIKRLKGDDCNESIHSLEHNKFVINDKNVIGGLFLKNFKEVPVELRNNILPSKNVYRIAPNDHSIFMRPTDEVEIINIISELTTKDSLGPIPLRVIKLSLHEMAKLLTIVFNVMIETGMYPNALKTARIVPVHKGESKKM